MATAAEVRKMEILEESADSVVLGVDVDELVGLYGSVFVALQFHEAELHTLTSIKPEAARALLNKIRPVLDRMRDARLKRGERW
jgi:hypothetical protein